MVVFALNILVTFVIVALALAAAGTSLITLLLAMNGNEKATRKLVLTEGGSLIVCLALATLFLVDGFNRQSDWVCEQSCQQAGADSGEEQDGACVCFDQLGVGQE